MKRLTAHLLHVYVFISVVIFFLVQSLILLQIDLPRWVSSYVKDFLVIPIVATISLHGVWWVKKDKTLRLNGFSILSIVILYSIYFEYYLPKTSIRYTADIWDVVCYAIGGIIFYLLQPRV